MARIAIHPGEHLAEELDALKMSAAELARQETADPEASLALYGYVPYNLARR